MSILSTVKKGYMTIKTASGYVKLLPRTLATLVAMSDGKSVEDKINELNGKFASTTNTTTLQNYRIGNTQIVKGTVIRVSQGDYVELFTLAQLKSYFGNNFTFARLGISTYNADSKEANVHFYAPEQWTNYNAFYQYYYPSRAVGANVQVGFCMIYTHP